MVKCSASHLISTTVLPSKLTAKPSCVQQFIEGTDIGSVWIQSIKTVLEHGIAVKDNKEMIREVSPLYLHIHNPRESDPIIERYGNPEVLSFMKQNFEGPGPVSNWGYSYAQRLYGDETFNPIAYVIERLQQYPTTKSATISLLNPKGDAYHTPCLTTLDFKIRDNALCVHAFFRSQDIGKKMYADALQLLLLGQKMIHQVPTEAISLYLTVCSAHIYDADIAGLEYLLSQCM